MKLHKPTEIGWLNIIFISLIVATLLAFYHCYRGHITFCSFDLCPVIYTLIWIAAFFIIRIRKPHLFKIKKVIE